MSLFKKVQAQIYQAKDNLKKGVHNGIPYPYAKLNEYLASMDKGQAIGVLGATGVAKSFFARYTFLYAPYKFYKETGYKLKILFFCLEDSKERAMQFCICHYLKEVHNTTITIKELNSRGRELPDFVKQHIDEAEQYFEDFEQIVTFIDGKTEPKELFTICKDLAMDLGEVETYYEEVGGKQVKQLKYTSDTHVVAVFDNMSNIDMSANENSEQEAILKFCKEYMRLYLCNFFNWTCIMIMQGDFESERASFSKAGDINIAKLEPSLASIGDSKRASRSFHLVFSLFSPQRHDIMAYPRPSKEKPDEYYRIDVLGNKFRSLRIIKANDTDVGMRIGLLFDALGGTFSELPPPTDKAGLAKVYEQFAGKQKFTKTSEVIQFKAGTSDDLPF